GAAPVDVSEPDVEPEPAVDEFAAHETPWPELGSHNAPRRAVTPGAIPTDAMGDSAGGDGAVEARADGASAADLHGAPDELDLMGDEHIDEHIEPDEHLE